MCRQVLLKVPNMTCHKNFQGGSRDHLCVQTGERMYTRPKVTFRTAFAKALKITERPVFLKPEMNGIMIFPVISWLRDVHKIVIWSKNQYHSILRL
jgi:hypothetical protein